ncbi:MAG: isoaspartyl peptidase/L-asparaginase, partial [Bacteroidia bacterium]|nr:isoaspartyl peptidase/L-asparaginase [Bacteroidia bacterium]
MMKLRNSFCTGIIMAGLFIISCQNRGKLQDNKILSDVFKKQDWAIVIHGGAGAMSTENLSPELDREYRAALTDALIVGKKILDEGGTALDAVEQTVRFMEDNPLFNAGKGAVFTHEGRNELDASIMDGSNLAAGAVAGVTDIRNPITAARTVMTKSQHVMLTGAGASQFAREQGL